MGDLLDAWGLKEYYQEWKKKQPDAKIGEEKENLIGEDEKRKLTKKTKTEAQSTYDKDLADQYKSEVKVGNERIDQEALRRSALGQTLTFDPRKGSGMYQGQQQFVSSNIAQAGGAANRAYSANEAMEGKQTFGSALSERGEEMGAFDRALMSGFEGPSSETKKMTESEALESFRNRLAAGGLATTVGNHGVKEALQSQFEAGRDEAKEKYVKEQVKAKTAEIAAKNAKVKENIAALQEQKREKTRAFYSRKFGEAAERTPFGIPQQFTQDDFEKAYKFVLSNKDHPLVESSPLVKYDSGGRRAITRRGPDPAAAAGSLLREVDEFQRLVATKYGGDYNRLNRKERETLDQLVETGVMQPPEGYNE